MTRSRTTRTIARLAVIAPLLAFAACGGDDADDADDASVTTEAAAAPTTATPATDAPATTTPSTTDPATSDPATSEPMTSVEPGLEEYCAVALEIFELDSPPTEELVAQYASVAPDEIAEPIGVIVDALEAANGDFAQVFADPEAGAAFEELTAYEAETCGIGGPVDEEATTVDPDATLVEVAATDYHFEAAFPTEAGRYSFSMANDGEEPHLMILVHLEEGAELAEVMASEGETGVIESFESAVAPPGSDAVITADLTPGNWVLVCPIPNAEGTSHAELGMVHEFEIA